MKIIINIINSPENIREILIPPIAHRYMWCSTMRLTEEIKNILVKQPFTVIVTKHYETGEPYIITVGKNPGPRLAPEHEDKIFFCRWIMKVTKKNLEKDPWVMVLAVDHEEFKSYRIFGRGRFISLDEARNNFNVKFPKPPCKEVLVVEVKKIQRGYYGDKTNQWLE